MNCDKVFSSDWLLKCHLAYNNKCAGLKGPNKFKDVKEE
jgi:hypothetical protein